MKTTFVGMITKIGPRPLHLNSDWHRALNTTAGINQMMLLFTIKPSFLIGKSCPALYSPINGSIVSQSCGSLFGSQATFACNKGHRLSGSRVRSCQEDGAWSGRNTSCSSKIKRERQGHPTTVFCIISIRERK